MMPSSTRILHVITCLGTGGAERSLHNLLAGGLAAQAECEVISLTDMGTFGPKIAALGVPVHTLEMPLGRPTLGGALALRKRVRTLRPDIIQGWMHHGNLAASLAQMLAPGRPKLSWNIRHSLHDLSIEKRSSQMAIRATKLLSGHPDAIIYNASVSRQQYEEFGFPRGGGVVIPNGFDTARWRPDPAARQHLRDSLSVSDEARLVGLVARYHPMKDINNFLRAMRPLMEQDPNLHCVVCGRDVDLTNPALADDLLLLPQERLHLLGERDDLPRVFPGLDLLCLSSAWGEGFPNVLGEAMACGVPCVATEVGDSRHVIGDSGRVVPASDTPALSGALAEMLALPTVELRGLSIAARNRTERLFTLDKTFHAYLDHYATLHESRGVCAT